MSDGLTEPQRRALEIIRDEPGLRPARFAEKMWPDSPGWRTRRKCGGYGVHQGGGMYVAAGQYLGKLRGRGLIETWSRDGTSEARLTRAGHQALEAQKEPQG